MILCKICAGKFLRAVDCHGADCSGVEVGGVEAGSVEEVTKESGGKEEVGGILYVWDGGHACRDRTATSYKHEASQM